MVGGDCHAVPVSGQSATGGATFHRDGVHPANTVGVTEGPARPRQGPGRPHKGPCRALRELQLHQQAEWQEVPRAAMNRTHQTWGRLRPPDRCATHNTRRTSTHTALPACITHMQDHPGHCLLVAAPSAHTHTHTDAHTVDATNRALQKAVCVYWISSSAKQNKNRSMSCLH